MYRSNSCGELTEKAVGKKVQLAGWVSSRRDHGNLIFIDLRDREGVTQVVFNPEKEKKAHETAKALRDEFVVKVEGIVGKRPKGTENEKIHTGKIEVNASVLEILSKAEALPFELGGRIGVSEDVRLKYRYLDLRRGEMQANIIARHKAAKAMRDYFNEKGFLEIETPILAKSTPEGARDYLVPSRVHEGKFFALPQSPQLFKQLLMVSGFDKYYQLAKCFRDEDLRADRQPEFTQIDVEMSFVNEDDVLAVAEGMLKRIWKDVLGVEVKTPFPRITHEEAMARFGSDKPDTRFGMELIDLTDLVKGCGFEVFSKAVKEGGEVKAIVAEKCAEYSRKQIEELTEFVKIFRAKGLVPIKVSASGIESPVEKFLGKELLEKIAKKCLAKKGDLVLVVAGQRKIVADSLGNLRVKLGKELKLIDEKKFNFLWVTDFPLLEWSEEDGKWNAMHHPFTSPREADLPLLEKSPEKAKARAYDITLNGVELGGGSIRIHRADIQSRVFSVLGISKDEAQTRFGFLLEAFKFGPPPHGGIAFGFDRIVAILTKNESIREVIAFPKNKSCVSLMDGAPSDVDSKQLKELKLKIDSGK
ncbi:MAG: aspartate--tRNA ligase [Candidatus Diapherotrites archaeon]